MSTLGRVAEFFGVQLQTVKQWRTGPKPMPGKPGAWPLDQIARWRLSRATSQAGGGSQTLKRRKLELENASRMMRLRRDSGELVSRVHAKAAVEQLFHEIRGRLESIPEEMIASVPPELQPQLLDDWRDKIAGVLKQLSQRENEDG